MNKPRKLTCILAVLACAFLSLPKTPLAADKLLQQSDLTYLGAFRVPADQFAYGGRPIAYNPARNSLFVGTANGEQSGREGLYEVSIPTPVNSSTVTSLNTATILQNSVNAFNGTINSIEPSLGGAFGGVLLNGSKLIVSGYGYYDANNSATKSHASINADWTTNGLGFSGLVTVGVPPAPDVGFTGGYMCPIPASWQSALGGKALTGQSNINVITRTSMGPAAFSFTPTLNTNLPSSTSANALLYYDDNKGKNGATCATHWIIGDFSSADGCNGGAVGTIVSGSDRIGGVVFPDGSKSVLFFGRHGDTYCYGPGTSDPAQAGQPFNNFVYCYDPEVSDEGIHGYPYHYRIWAYNADDLAAVKAGTKNPWEVTPYAYWNVTFPINGWKLQIDGATYDPANKRLFISMDHGDGSAPLVQVYSVNVTGGGGADTTPPSAPRGLSVQ